MSSVHWRVSIYSFATRSSSYVAIRPSYCVIDCGADGSDGVRHPRSPKKAGTVMFEGTVEANDAIERRKAVRPR